MPRENKFAGELAVGIFVDGRYLRIVCLSKHKDNIRLIDARSLILAKPIESSHESEELISGESSIDLTPKETNADSEQDLEESSSIDLELDLDLLEAHSKPEPPPKELKPPVEVMPEETAAFDLAFLEQNKSQIQAIATEAFGENGDSEMPVDIDFLLSPQHSPDTENDLSASTEFSDLDLLNQPKPEPQQDPLVQKIPVTNSSESRKTSLGTPGLSDDIQDNASILHEVLSHYPPRKYKVAISLPDPQTYYSYFNTDWGLGEKKLKEKIIEELSKERSDNNRIEAEAVSILRLAEENLMAITRDAEVGILNLLDTLRDSLENRLPKISFVESAEISLVNLVKENYHFPDDEITVIVYVGHEFSRFIFLQGNLLHHISPIIGEGADSFLVFGSSLSLFANTIYSRLLLETDDLNLNKIDNVILAGEAREAVLKSLLVGLFPKKVNIEEIKFVNLDTFGVSSAIEKMLPHTAVALGSAWRALDDSNDSLYQVNLIPSKIKEEQKIFKLGIFGWLLLFMIPIFTLFFTKQFFQHDNELRRLKTQHGQVRSELSNLQKKKTQLDARMEKLNYYTNTFGVLDSLVVGTESWSKFLNKISRKATQIGGIWLTELETVSAKSVILKGYSLTRAKIPIFSNAIGNSILQQVQVQEIRKRRIYNFTIEARLEAPKATPTPAKP